MQGCTAEHMQVSAQPPQIKTDIIHQQQAEKRDLGPKATPAIDMNHLEQASESSIVPIGPSSDTFAFRDPCDLSCSMSMAWRKIDSSSGCCSAFSEPSYLLARIRAGL